MHGLTLDDLVVSSDPLGAERANQGTVLGGWSLHLGILRDGGSRAATGAAIVTRYAGCAG